MAGENLDEIVGSAKPEKTSRIHYDIRGKLSTDIGGVLVVAGIGALVAGAITGGIVLGAYCGYVGGDIVGWLVNACPYIKDAVPNAARALGLNPGSDYDVNIMVGRGVGTLTGSLGFGSMAFKIAKGIIKGILS